MKGYRDVIKAPVITEKTAMYCMMGISGYI